MKNNLINIIINIVGALVCFAIFSFNPFLNRIVDNTSFIFPWWIWGLVGLVAFEIVYFLILLKNEL